MLNARHDDDKDIYIYICEENRKTKNSKCNELINMVKSTLKHWHYG